VVFVYNHFCTHRKINARQVIKEYTILKEHQCLQGINQLKNIPGYRNDPTFIRLKSYGLQFLDLYIRSLREHEKDHMTHREMERQLRELMDVAAASYLQYLQLRSSGMKDALARKRVGLEDEVFYRIALYTFMLREVTP